jgi:hypothetical protein
MLVETSGKAPTFIARRKREASGLIQGEPAMSKQYKHIFLSYCHDNQAEAKQLRDDLLAAGESVWWDQNILAGQNWKIEIRKALKDSYAVVICFSKETEARTESGIYPELLDAIDAYRNYAPGGIFLIPVRLSECDIPLVEIGGAVTLDQLQRVDLFPSANRSDGVNRLLESLRNSSRHP